MTILEALENALHLLQANGYLYGDVHDDLALSIVRFAGGVSRRGKVREGLSIPERLQ
jgi:hypothetical protein